MAVDVGRNRLEQGTVEELQAPVDRPHAVVMLDVLEHLADPLASLRRIRPILEDEGILVLSTVNLSSLHARLRAAEWPWFIRSHLYYFSPQTTRAMLSEAGFRMVEWTTVPRSFRLPYLARRAGSSHGALGAIAKRVSTVVHPRLPVGWLGD